MSSHDYHRSSALAEPALVWPQVEQLADVNDQLDRFLQDQRNYWEQDVELPAEMKAGWEQDEAEMLPLITPPAASLDVRRKRPAPRRELPGASAPASITPTTRSGRRAAPEVIDGDANAAIAALRALEPANRARRRRRPGDPITSAGLPTDAPQGQSSSTDSAGEAARGRPRKRKRRRGGADGGGGSDDALEPRQPNAVMPTFNERDGTDRAAASATEGEAHRGRRRRRRGPGQGEDGQSPRPQEPMLHGPRAPMPAAAIDPSLRLGDIGPSKRRRRPRHAGGPAQPSGD